MAETAAVPNPLANPTPQPLQQRLVGKLHALGFSHNRWQASLTEGQTIADALQPTFWQHHASAIMGFDKLKPGGLMDVIELRKPDTMDYWELLVTGVGPGFIRTRVVKESTTAPLSLDESGPLVTRWNGKSHDVIRSSDRQLMQGGFQSKAAAAAWIADHLKKMAA